MMNNIKIDFNNQIKKMKPLHGVNNGPLHRGNVTDESVFFEELQPPFVRLHDMNWPHSREVDIHAVFPDFTKDPSDPNSYDFEMTDKYLNAIKAVGSDIIYRLGESIAAADYKRFVNPPSDMEKWARVCIGIIKHYNDGWANGFHHNIKYWEIWNEPSVETMWTGTLDQYLEMYTATAKAIRAYDPKLKICGPAACSSDRITNKVFLKYINENLEIPHDVYTFHLYGHSVENTGKYLEILNETFEKYNKRDFDVFITEWNYAPQTDKGEGFWDTIAKGDVKVNASVFRKIGSLEAACYSAGFLTKLQDSVVTQANYFHTSPTSYFSCFDIYGIPNKVFYGLLAYKRAFNFENQVEVKNSCETIYTLASANDKGFAFYASNYKSDVTDIEFNIILPEGVKKQECQISVVNEEFDLEVTNSLTIISGETFNLSIPRNSIVLVESI